MEKWFSLVGARWRAHRPIKRSGRLCYLYPGSNAGIPVSILASLSAPPQALLDDPELLRERINTTADQPLRPARNRS